MSFEESNVSDILKWSARLGDKHTDSDIANRWLGGTTNNQTIMV